MKLSWYTIRVFYSVKHVADELVRARDVGHAHKLAAYTARTIARDSIPPWMFDEGRVNWLVFEVASKVSAAEVSYVR